MASNDETEWPQIDWPPLTPEQQDVLRTHLSPDRCKVTDSDASGSPSSVSGV